MPSPIQPGQVIKGKYRVDRVLGEGGMGVVVAGSHVGLGQRVAIKFLHPAMLAHPEIVERFAREARAASRLESDHVARVTDVDTMEDGAPFMVMEYLEGSDLSTVRATGQPLPLHVAVGYILEACEALGEAHALGIVHRDIKPANLFLAQRSGGKTRLKVLDFGISKGTGDGDGGMTRTSTVMGSAHYMSPEQMLTPREVDLRTDIWALGITLFELTTADLPFPGESLPQVCAMIMSMQPPPPSSVNPALPSGFDAIVMRCLARSPQERFGSVQELAAALADFAVSAAPSFGRAPMASSAQLAVEAVTSNPTSDPGLGTYRQNVAPGSDPLGETPLMFQLPAAPPAISPQPHAQPHPQPHLQQHAQPQPHLQSQPSWPSHSATPSAHPSHPSQPSQPSPSHDVRVAPMTVVHTAAPVSHTDATPKVASRVPMIAGIVALGGLVLGGTALMLLFRSASPPATGSDGTQTSVIAAPPPSQAQPSAIPQTTASNAPIVTPAAETAPAPRESASAAPTPAKSAKPSSLARPAAPPPPAAAATAKKPAVNCNPPFIVDAQGVKRAKPECL